MSSQQQQQQQQPMPVAVHDRARHRMPLWSTVEARPRSTVLAAASAAAGGGADSKPTLTSADIAKITRKSLDEVGLAQQGPGSQAGVTRAPASQLVAGAGTATKHRAIRALRCMHACAVLCADADTRPCRHALCGAAAVVQGTQDRQEVCVPGLPRRLQRGCVAQGLPRLRPAALRAVRDGLPGGRRRANCDSRRQMGTCMCMHGHGPGAAPIPVSTAMPKQPTRACGLGCVSNGVGHIPSMGHIPVAQSNPCSTDEACRSAKGCPGGVTLSRATSAAAAGFAAAHFGKQRSHRPPAKWKGSWVLAMVQDSRLTSHLSPCFYSPRCSLIDPLGVQQKRVM